MPLRAKPKRVETQAQARATSPYRETYHPPLRRYGIPKAQWPPDILAGWQAYRERCGMRLRETTFRTYEKCMATYLGYLTTISERAVTWDGLFELAPLRAFLAWHAARLQGDLSTHAFQVVVMLATIAASISLIPLGLGSFEAVCVAALSLLGVRLEVALAATLLLRAFASGKPAIVNVKTDYRARATTMRFTNYMT